MIKYNSNSINKWYYGAQQAVKVVYDGINAFDGTGGGSPVPCYEVIPTSITAYTSTTYSSVYSFIDSKWYMFSNFNQYEEYGVYETGSSLADFTYYDGKLVAVGTTEYQRSGNTWVEVGTYEDVSVTYTIDNTSPSPYVGQELSTTFKIPYADVESVGLVSFYISNINNDSLTIELATDGLAVYKYIGSDYYEGTVTNDGEYFYLSLPSEAPQSIVINRVNYFRSGSIHLIFGSKEITVEYEEKPAPSYSIYSTVQEMESVGCPNVGINEYAFVGNDLYKYSANEEWNGITYHEPKMVAIYENGDPLVVYNNNNSTLEKNETKLKDISPISVYVGDNVTGIGVKAFYDNSNITSVTIPNTVTTISAYGFCYCVNLKRVNSNTDGVANIPNGVTTLGAGAFAQCHCLTTVTIPSSVTKMDFNTFYNSSGLTSVTVEATTPPTLGNNAFYNTSCPIYVPSQSVDAYKSASGWSNYASRIQAIP